MCGRYVSVRSDGDVLREFDAYDATDDEVVEPDYNVAPTKPVRAVVNRPLRDAAGNRADHPTRQLRVMTWGLVPSWAKDRSIAARLINARVESVATKPAFRKAYAARRCLVPADGWYEWQVVDGPSGPAKQPMYMTPQDGHVLAFAGLVRVLGSAGPDDLDLHDHHHTVDGRAGRGARQDAAAASCLGLAAVARPRGERTRRPAPAVGRGRGERLELRPVSTAVNKVDNNGAELVKRVEAAVQAQTLF